MLPENFSRIRIALVVAGMIIVVGLLWTLRSQPESEDKFMSTPISGTSYTGKPYRTFLTIERYNMEFSGQPNEISNVRLEITFPNKKTLELPEGGKFWPIANGQNQEIHRTFELPSDWMVNDGFRLKIQMIRKGSEMLPCLFEVVQLSEFNRGYICQTDTGWQAQQNIPSDQHDREGIQIRVFTDKNSPPREIPNDALAIKF